jgi:iron complex outermembrane receptor protein
MKRVISISTVGLAIGTMSALAWPLTSQAQTASLDEIIVTARKRVESLEDTPISITAFTGNDVSMRGATDVNDLLRSVPNVTTDNNLTIRGIGYNTRNIGIEAGATVYVDGVYTGRPDSFNQNLTDVRGIEILRGPQGTLFGKNSIAGVISITTQQPVLNEWSAHVLGSYGNEDASRAQLTVNAPMGNTAALRVSVGHEEIGGYLKNLYNGRYFNGDNATSLRAALRWVPSDALEVTVRANYLHDHNTSRLGQGETADGVDSQTPPPRVVVAPGPFTPWKTRRPTASPR